MGNLSTGQLLGGIGGAALLGGGAAVLIPNASPAPPPQPPYNPMPTYNTSTPPPPPPPMSATPGNPGYGRSFGGPETAGSPTYGRNIGMDTYGGGAPMQQPVDTYMPPQSGYYTGEPGYGQPAPVYANGQVAMMPGPSMPPPPPRSNWSVKLGERIAAFDPSQGARSFQMPQNLPGRAPQYMTPGQRPPMPPMPNLPPRR